MKNATIAMNAIPIANDVTEMINSAESRGSRKIKIPETSVKKMATRNQARPSSGLIIQQGSRGAEGRGVETFTSAPFRSAPLQSLFI